MRRKTLVSLGLALALVAIPSIGSAQLTAGQQTADPTLPERGRYLVETLAYCGACHGTSREGTPPAPGMALGGGRVFAERGFRAVAPNISPDPETGIGRWTDAQIAASIRDGVRPDGSLIGPPMPVESYRGISDRDLTAMVAYLRAAAPVRHAVAGGSRYPFALTPHGPSIASVPEPPENDPVARGAYIAINVAHCMDCHSGQLSEGRRDPARAGALGLVLEGPFGTVQTANISSHAEHGIGRWSDEEVMRAVTQGVSRDGRRLAPPMGGRAPVWARLTDRDKRDLLAYLRSLPPQE